MPFSLSQTFDALADCNDDFILYSSRFGGDNEARAADNSNGGYWCWTNTGSPSSGTGPPSGVACMYTETSSPSAVGDVFYAELRTAINASLYNLSVSFQTCMQGNSAGTLYFEAWDGSDWNIIAQWSGDSGTSFTSRGPYDFSPTGEDYDNTDFKIRFRVVTGGTSYQNDFAVDTVSITGTDKQTLGAGMIMQTAERSQASAGAENPGTFDFEQSLPWGAITIALRLSSGVTTKNVAPTSKFNTFTDDVSVVVQDGAEIDGLAFEGDIELADVLDITGVVVEGALDFSASGEYDFTNCTINEVTNSSGGSVTINATNCVITTNTGPNITINNSVPIFVSAKTLTGSDIQGARVYIEAASGGPLSAGTEIINTLTDVNGEVSDTFNFTSNQPVIGRVRRGSTTPYFKTYPFTGTITSSGLTINAILVTDE